MKYNMEINNKLLQHLLSFISENRKKRFNEIIKYRTRHISIVLEDIYQPHNASAVLRTCDLTGIQDVHIIENKNEYELNPEVALGSSKWLSLTKYNDLENNTLSALNSLKEKGYKIIATTPHKDALNPESIPLDNKIAVVFGTELTGISETVMNEADSYMRIPMYGFTESYNISVSAAITLYTLAQRLRGSDISWQLSNNEITDILLNWCRNSISRCESIENHFTGVNN
jgi:tRNA (guanosine-2'-O-)-methyltransferase